MVLQLTQLAFENHRVYDAEIAKLKEELSQHRESLKSHSMERDGLLAFKRSCEGLPDQVDEAKKQLKDLRRTLEELRASKDQYEARLGEVREAKRSMAMEYKASIEYTKDSLEAFSAGFNCGLKKVTLYRPDFPVESIAMSFSSKKVRSESQVDSSAPINPIEPTTSASASKGKKRGE